MNYLFCILIGYAIGTINPSFLLAKACGFDIRKRGSGNAGASNVLILFGKALGISCALFDIAKATAAIHLATFLFPNLSYAFSVTAVAAIVGHIFPFYMKFRGGKGLACLGGAILAFDWRVFLIMLVTEAIFAVAVNYICFVPLTACVIFPIVYGVMRADLWGALILCLIIPIIFYKHLENLGRIKNGTEARLSFLWNKKGELERMNIPNTDA
jgi:glycerol-3-phosphate acyltransferase PlsY